MKLELKRSPGTVGFTHGKLYNNGVFECDTLEDQERAVKVYGATAIAKGFYKVIINVSNRFKRRMPLLLNVPNFEGIRIHNGNTAKDTDGCILVGTYSVEGYVKDSRVAFNRLLAKMEAAQKRGEVITIDIT